MASVQERVKKYRKLHPERNREIASNCKKKKWDLVFLKYNERCIRCGFSDRRALQIDHINGGGNQEKNIRLKNNWHKWMRMVIEDQTGKYQILCANCNWIKRCENREYNKKYIMG